MSPKGTPTIQPAKGVEYETPRDLFDQLWREFGGFDLDPCCRLEHYTAKRVLNNGGMIYVPPDTHSKPYRMLVDGLAHPWNADAVFCNPPYGPALRQWIPKAVAEVEIGNALRQAPTRQRGAVPARAPEVWGRGWAGPGRQRARSLEEVG